MNLVIPPPSSSATTNVMRSNKARNTRPELMLRSALWATGLNGYRISYKKAPGRPDIAYPSKRIAIFVHGCFWHRCPRCNMPLPKSHKGYWKEKFKRNNERDIRKRQELENLGWRVFEFWECEIKKNPGRLALKVKNQMRAT
jgi:DNA mismatch endonuclease (patch repair protein)